MAEIVISSSWRVVIRRHRALLAMAECAALADAARVHGMRD